MTLTSAQSLRLRIQDQPALAVQTFESDGSATLFALQHRNVVSGSAFIPGASGWTATAAAFNPTGYVELSGAIANHSALMVRYVHSVFSDSEIDHLIDGAGSIPGAALEAVKVLMFDGLRRAKWKSSDGSEYDDTKAIDLLKDMYDTFKQELEAATLEEVSGAFISWAANQDD